MSKRVYSLIFLLLGLSLLPATAQQFTAQTAGGQIERARLPNPSLPLSPATLSLGEPADAGNTEPPYSPSTSGDADLGVQSLLRAPVRRQPWSIFADGGVLFTTNVALTSRNEQNDTFFIGEGGVSYDFKLTPDLALTAVIRQQYFAYSRFDQLDFGALNIGVSMAYTAHNLGDVVISTQLGFTRLTRQGVWDNEFYRAGTLGLGAEKVFSFGRAQLLSVGGDISLGIAFPHTSEREEFGISAGYIAQLTRHLSVQTGTRIAYFLYADTGRNDFNVAGSAGATYAITPWCSVGASLSGTVDRSSRAVFDYDVFNTGASVFFRLKF